MCVRLILATLLATLSAAAPAAALTFPADALGGGGDQHITYPSFSSPTTSAPLMTAGDVGDVNGDGRDDIAAGFAGAGPNDESDVYVTFSSPLASIGDALGLGGFKIITRFFWFGLSSAGDVNGDGLGDVAIVRGDEVLVVFGRTDGKTVDTDDLGNDGFTISGAGMGVGGGFDGIMINRGVAPLGDVNGDGVPDLLVSDGASAAIVYPPRDVAGRTIYAGTPGPHVSTIDEDGDHLLDQAAVDVLGDVDHDGRTDVMVAGEEVHGTDEVAYGVATPLPGAAITLPAAVDAGRAFSIRTHDGKDGWYGELEQARTLGDQNGDGIRDVGMLCGGCGSGGRQLRVIYSPAFGAKVDAGDLAGSDARGWSFHSYADIVDAGDQNGDGVGDIADRNYVYYPDPEHETGSDSPSSNGFYFRGGGEVVASLADVNGDGRREIALATVKITDNNGSDSAAGQSATYAIDIYDSATAPVVSLPDLPVIDAGGLLDVGVTIDPGAGSRGAGDLALHPTLQLATPTGAPQTAADPGIVSGQRQLRLSVTPSRALGGAPLVAGDTYRVRAAAINGRGEQAVGPWRSFVYSAAGLKPAKQSTPSKAKAGSLRLTIGAGPLVLRNGRLAVRVTCGASSGRCRGTLRLTRGRSRVGSAGFSIAARRHATVRVRVGAAARRTLSARRRMTIVATATATSADHRSGKVVKRMTARSH